MHNRAPLTGLLAAILLGLLTAVPGGPGQIDAAFAAAPDGRLVVTWRDTAPATLADGDVESFRPSRANAHPALGIAKGGRAAALAAPREDDPRHATLDPDPAPPQGSEATQQNPPASHKHARSLRAPA